MTLKEYEVTVDGRHPHKTTMLLSEAEAERLGGVEVNPTGKPAKAAPAPANKARTPKNKAVKPAATKAAAKTEKPATQKPTGKPDPASDPDASE